ncbi:MAG: FtsX-like permease family protein, partial [Longimicrobiales bacterium]
QADGSHLGIGVNSLHAQTVGTTGRALGLFLGAAGLLLLLAAMNAATLLLARSLDRTQELGVRMALGAGRGRVVRLLVSEAGILSVVGGAFGVLLAYGGVGVFLHYAPSSIPRLSTVAVDARVLAVAAVVSLGTGIAAGLLPALRLTRRGPWERLQTAGRAFVEPSSRLRGVLVGGQMAVAVVLLSGAGLLFGSFVRMTTADPGFEADGVITMNVEAKGGSRWNFQAHWVSWDVLLDEVRAVPGVESVAATSIYPLQSPRWAPRLLLPGDTPETVREGIARYAITPGYHETMGTRLLLGRDIERMDGPDAERVALVNESFVRTQLGGGDPIDVIVGWSAGDEWSVGDEWRPPAEWLAGEATPLRIVGVVEDVVQMRVGEGPRAAIYVPYTQSRPVSPSIVVRTTRAPEVIMPELHRAAVRFNPRIPPVDLDTMEDRMSATRTTPRFQAMLIGAFALVAMLLAAAGLYGSLAHSVSRRQRELGVRMALGADRAGVLRMVLGQGMRLSVAGLAVGMIAALLSTRVLSGFLYGVEPNDPVTMLMVGAVLVLVSAVACLAPARRATAVDPVTVLKAE